MGVASLTGRSSLHSGVPWSPYYVQMKLLRITDWIGTIYTGWEIRGRMDITSPIANMSFRWSGKSTIQLSIPLLVVRYVWYVASEATGFGTHAGRRGSP